MNLAELEQSGLIFYRTIVGSNAYGTNTSASDIDEKGFYWVDPSEYLGLTPPVTQKDGQVSEERNNRTFYSLYKAFDLLKEANPNMIELLWMPSDCILHSNPLIMGEWIKHRKLFISKRAYYSHAEYARNQIKKAKGANKKVHNPCPEQRPLKEDFVRIIDLREAYNMPYEWIRMLCDNELHEGIDMDSRFPCRPRPVSETDIDLGTIHVSSIEHSPNNYRMYYYGDKAKGVFRGNDMLVCESIPKEDEQRCFIGILIYDKNEYDKALKDWHSYWDWMRNRNEARWIDQEKGLLTYDAKNMCHCMRLMMESAHILSQGEPLVRYSGEELDFLMKIRCGEFAYEELMEKVEELDKKLIGLLEKSTLPEVADPEKLDSLYRRLMEIGAKVYARK